MPENDEEYTENDIKSFFSQELFHQRIKSSLQLTLEKI